MLILLWMAFALMFILIGFGIYWWKENENLSRKEIFKKFSWKIALYLLFVGVIYSYKNYIPFNKNHGIEFNNEREKIGIPKIGENWKNKNHQSEQFVTYWHKVESKNGHFEKIIEYGILGIKTETDYFQNKKLKETIAWSKYDFRNNTFEYFLEKPYEQNISETNKENLKLEKLTKIFKINKEEFEKYLTK